MIVDESELSFMESVFRMSTRKELSSKLGIPIYSITLYDNVKRTTILLDNKDHPILMLSFDSDNSGFDHDSFIMNGVLPLAMVFLSSSVHFA